MTIAPPVGRSCPGVSFFGGLLPVLASFGAACGGGANGPGSQEHWPVDAGPDGMAGQGGTATLCAPTPRTSEDLSPRIDLVHQVGMAAGGAPARQVMKTSDLFQRFNTTCGRCHVATANGGFQASDATFATVFDQTRMLRLESDDPTFAMPPEGKAFSSRAANDPVVQLARLLEQWLAQGRPSDMFFVEDASAPAAGDGFYAYTTLTNMGDCVPARQIYASSISGEMDAKDAFFAGATALPANLADTDLTTFDTAALAANGVIAFRPTYALWSAGSRKLRFVRVPKGTSIVFDKDKQTFSIPPNTRFYKTFFRRVIDSAGRTSYRKMETRLIVSRPDTVDADGKTPRPTALFGTYVWSDDEMSAHLLDAPYRDGTPFADRTSEYVTNEIEYQDIIDGLPPGAASLTDKLKQELADPRHLDLVQHYAVPGSLRCVQCHRGSAGRDFVLGFLPLQIAQRAAGTGGTYDPVDSDELDQLQRFIDYGLITGMGSPADVVKLEDSQLPRRPRTDGELQAQAYMLGNCAHCHNPRGYPSLLKPELLAALNFLPGSAPDAGIFELSLEKMSPVRQRGANQDIAMPYITPSLRDYPVADTFMTRIDNGASIEAASDNGTGVKHEVTWTPKYNPTSETFPGPVGCRKVGDSADSFRRSYCGDRVTGHSFVAAPWRSLIYRNVDTPFPYFDDYVPFPHMPMNTAGFDCRVPRIMGEWMVGLPARLKAPYQLMSEDTLPHLKQADGSYYPDFVDAAQPYEEVKPTDPDYAVAKLAAQNRLAEYHASVRYGYCPDTLSADILDPIRQANQAVGSARDELHFFYPIPVRYLNGGVPPADPANPGQYVQPALGVPYHAEWFDYDPTDSPPPWQPRRGPTWKDILVDGKPDSSPPAGQASLDEQTITDRRRLIAALQPAQLTDALRSYATTEVPYGLWLQKPECAGKLSAANSIRKVSDIAPAERPVWMNTAGASLSPDAPVYMAAPGFALYRHICFNCHGPKADGKGLQGDALAASSEGRTRPANLAGGLLGPPEMPGSNLARVFDLGTGDPDQWGSRYVGWMTLGGTLQLIPQDVVNQVQATKVLGSTRPNLGRLVGEAAGVSANMLNLAKGLCAEVLPDESALANLTAPTFSGAPVGAYAILNDQDRSAFIRSNYDWEMWMNFCSKFNRPVVRVYGLRTDRDGALEAFFKALYYGDGDGQGHFAYPAGQKIWDQNMTARDGLTADNYYASCFQEPTSPLAGEGPSNVEPGVYQEFRAKLAMPACPKDFLGRREAMMWNSQTQEPEQIDAVKEWTLRGAINAAMSVFSYLKKTDLAHHDLPPYYNECQKLP